jgi:hypothetical protein
VNGALPRIYEYGGNLLLFYDFQFEQMVGSVAQEMQKKRWNGPFNISLSEENGDGKRLVQNLLIVPHTEYPKIKEESKGNIRALSYLVKNRIDESDPNRISSPSSEESAENRTESLEMGTAYRLFCTQYDLTYGPSPAVPGYLAWLSGKVTLRRVLAVYPSKNRGDIQCKEFSIEERSSYIDRASRWLAGVVSGVSLPDQQYQQCAKAMEDVASLILLLYRIKVMCLDNEDLLLKLNCAIKALRFVDKRASYFYERFVEQGVVDLLRDQSLARLKKIGEFAMKDLIPLIDRIKNEAPSPLSAVRGPKLASQLSRTFQAILLDWQGCVMKWYREHSELFAERPWCETRTAFSALSLQEVEECEEMLRRSLEKGGIGDGANVKYSTFLRNFFGVQEGFEQAFLTATIIYSGRVEETERLLIESAKALRLTPSLIKSVLVWSGIKNGHIDLDRLGNCKTEMEKGKKIFEGSKPHYRRAEDLLRKQKKQFECCTALLEKFLSFIDSAEPS